MDRECKTVCEADECGNCILKLRSLYSSLRKRTDQRKDKGICQTNQGWITVDPKRCDIGKMILDIADRVKAHFAGFFYRARIHTAALIPPIGISTQVVTRKVMTSIQVLRLCEHVLCK